MLRVAYVIWWRYFIAYTTRNLLDFTSIKTITCYFYLRLSFYSLNLHQFSSESWKKYPIINYILKWFICVEGGKSGWVGGGRRYAMENDEEIRTKSWYDYFFISVMNAAL